MPWNLQVDARPAAVAYPAFPAEVADVRPCGGRGGPPGRAAGHRPRRAAAGRPARRRRPAADLGDDRAARSTPNGAPPGSAPACGGATSSTAPAPWGSRRGTRRSPSVGVVGSSLGGGISWYARHAGLQCSALTAVEVVLADGTFVRATDDPDSELLWAARGGGGGFGVVTALEFDLLPVPRGVRRHARLGLDPRASACCGPGREWAAEAPDEVTSVARLLQPPTSLAAGRRPGPPPGRHRRRRRSATRRRPTGSSRRCGPAAGAGHLRRRAGGLVARLHLDPEDPTAVYASSVLLDDLPDAPSRRWSPPPGPARARAAVRRAAPARGRADPTGPARRRAGPHRRRVPGARRRASTTGAGWAAVREDAAPGAWTRCEPWATGVGVPADGRRAASTSAAAGRPRPGERLAALRARGRPARPVRPAPLAPRHG